MAGTLAQGLVAMIEQYIELPISSPDLSNTGSILEESVTALNQKLELDPQNAAARQALYETMQQMLRKDAFLAYQNETNDHYTIRTFAEFQFVHPKDRALPDIFPRLEQAPSQKAISWLGWSLVGLIPAGLGTLVCAPLAMLAAIKLLLQKNSLNDRRRAWVVLGTVIVLWLVALAFLMILLLHLV
jgi:disulfide bond formation protein DsbB